MAIENVVDCDGDPLGDPSIEAMRRYLLRADILGGYVPQIVLPEPQSRLWTAFWFGVRRIDDLLDDHGLEVLPIIVEFADRLDAVVVLRAFMRAAPVVAEARRRVLETARTPTLERRLLEQGALPTARELFALWYSKTYAPTYLGQRLLLADSDERVVRRLAKLTGAAMQLTDDLLDLDEDRIRGRCWLCKEELEHLGLPAGGLRIPDHALPRLVSLRRAVCLSYLLTADAVSLRLAPVDRPRIASFLDGFVRFVLSERFRPYAPNEMRPGERLRTILGCVPGTEDIKHRLLHGANDCYVSLRRGQPDRRAACRRLERLGDWPRQMSPDVCLEVMERIESRPQRTAEMSALGRALTQGCSSAGVQRAERSLRVTAAALQDPTLAEILAHRLALDRQLLSDAAGWARRASRELRAATYEVADLRRDLHELAGASLRYSADVTALAFETIGAVARLGQAFGGKRHRRSGP